jgi:hypothetical protein
VISANLHGNCQGRNIQVELISNYRRETRKSKTGPKIQHDLSLLPFLGWARHIFVRISIVRNMFLNPFGNQKPLLTFHKMRTVPNVIYFMADVYTLPNTDKISCDSSYVLKHAFFSFEKNFPLNRDQLFICKAQDRLRKILNNNKKSRVYFFTKNDIFYFVKHTRLHTTTISS